MVLPDAYHDRMRSQLGDAFEAYLAAMERMPRRALRVNLLKTDTDAFAAVCGFPLEPDGVIPEGFSFPTDSSRVVMRCMRPGFFTCRSPRRSFRPRCST